MVAATMDNIMMVEGEMKEVQESEMLEPSVLHTMPSRFIVRHSSIFLQQWVNWKKNLLP